MVKFLQLFVLVFITSFAVKAQNSYVYIEGIKGIPFNVTCDNKDVPKLGKGYCILTFTTPGEKIIDISFANTNFTKQRFVLDVQSNSSYGFRMGKTDENKFYLIDIVNEGKIIETNTPVNLALSTDKNILNFFKPKEVVVKNDSTNLGEDGIPVEESKPIKKKQKVQVDVLQEPVSASVPANEEITNDSAKVSKAEARAVKRANKKAKSVEVIEPVIETTKEEKYGVVEVISPSNNQVTTPKVEKIESPVAPAKVVKTNNCSKTASDEEIKSIKEKLVEKEDDEAKLLLIKKRIVSGCYTSKQVYDLAQNFDTQYGRYSLVRFVYPLTSDPSNLITLDSLFKYETYKLKLKKIVETP